jgi:hypothetical protein
MYYRKRQMKQNEYINREVKMSIRSTFQLRIEAARKQRLSEVGD